MKMYRTGSPPQQSRPMLLHGEQGLGIDVSALEAMSSGVPSVLVVADDVIPGVSLTAYPGLPV